MGGDSDSRKKKKSSEPATIPTTTVQPFMPGLDSMIAQQLGMGGFGDQASLLSYMNSIHTPMQVPTNSLPPPASGKNKNGGDDTNFVSGLTGLNKFLGQYARGY